MTSASFLDDKMKFPSTHETFMKYVLHIITYVAHVHGCNVASVRSRKASMRRYYCGTGNIYEDRVFTEPAFASQVLPRSISFLIDGHMPDGAPHTATVIGERCLSLG